MDRCRLAVAAGMRVTEVALHAFCALLGWLWFRRRMSGAAALGTALGRAFESLGGAFLKAAQLLSTRRDLLPSDACAALARLQSQVNLRGRHDGGANRSARAWRTKASGFAEIETEPRAVGSMAAVFGARLTDGRRVVVKVRHSQVAHLLAVDLALLRIIGWGIQRLSAFASVPVLEALAEVSAMVARQADFCEEIRSNRDLRRHFAGVPGVIIPEVIEELCEDGVLVMEEIDTRDERKSGPDLRSAAAKRAVQAVFKMMFCDGLVHCDLHPGNLILRDDGQIVLLDFGMMARLSDTVRGQFVRFFIGFATGDGLQCATIIDQIAKQKGRRYNFADFSATVDKLVKKNHGRKALEFSVVRFVADLFDAQRAMTLRAGEEFATAILALAYLEGRVKDKYPDLDFQREAFPFLSSAMMQHVFGQDVFQGSRRVFAPVQALD